MKAFKSRKSRRWLLGILLTLLLIPLLLFVGSNLFLGSSLGSDFLKKNLNRHTVALDWEVAGARWSPWNGITVGELSAQFRVDDAQLPANLPPLLSLKEVNLKPYWGQLLRRKKLFREVVLEGPQLDIPLELMFATSSAPPPAPVEKATPTLKEETPPAKPAPSSQPKALPTSKENGKTQKPQQKKEQPRPPDERRIWLRFRNAKVRLHSLTLDQALVVHDLNLDLPLAGPPAEGSIAWREVSLSGRPLLTETSLPIAWEHPAWTLPPQKLALQIPQFFEPEAKPIPLDLHLGGAFAFRARARNFSIQTAIPPQPLPDYVVHHPSQFHVRSPSLSATLAGRGSVLSLNTWRFNSEVALNEVEAFSDIRGQRLLFDTARLKANLRQANLRVPSISLRSEKVSLMGNGQLNLGGYLLAVLRIVADPALTEKFSDIAVGSNLSRGWMSSWLRPLETPDRYYRDLHFEGQLPNAMVNTGRQGEFLPLPEVVSLLKRFISIEVAEESNPSL